MSHTDTEDQEIECTALELGNLLMRSSRLLREIEQKDNNGAQDKGQYTMFGSFEMSEG